MLARAGRADGVGGPDVLVNLAESERARDHDGHGSGDGQSRAQPGGQGDPADPGDRPHPEPGPQGAGPSAGAMRCGKPATDPLQAITGRLDGLGRRVQGTPDDGLVVVIV
jgi:hypothetical protein